MSKETLYSEGSAYTKVPQDNLTLKCEANGGWVWVVCLFIYYLESTWGLPFPRNGRMLEMKPTFAKSFDQT